MAPKHWGIVYGIANPHIRKHIYPDDDLELDDRSHVGPGEKIIKVPIDPSHTPERFHEVIAEHVCRDAGVDKLTPISFVVIDPTNTVIEVHVGDKNLYSPPPKDHTHVNIAHGDADIGHTWDPKTRTFKHPISGGISSIKL